MHEYDDQILEKYRTKCAEYAELIKSGRLSASIGWPISMVKRIMERHLALAELGVHEFFRDICNCGLVSPEHGITGHRDHSSKELLARKFQLSVTITEDQLTE